MNILQFYNLHNGIIASADYMYEYTIYNRCQQVQHPNPHQTIHIEAPSVAIGVTAK